MTKLAPNEIEVFETHAEVILCRRNKSECARALISLEDVPTVGEYRWWLTNFGYCRGELNDKKGVQLHRFVLETPNGIFVDHKNQNKLDCRRENLRPCTKAQNSMNRNVPANSTTGYTGVSFDKRKGKYRAIIKLNGKQIWLGYFETVEKAAERRKEAEIEHFKEFKPH